MRSLVLELSGHRLYRDLFWQFAAIGPWVLLGSLVVMLMPSWRQWAAIGVLVAGAVAIIATLVFHNTYALAIWDGHDSAIRYLDQSAFLAGYVAGWFACGIALAARAAVARLRRRTRAKALRARVG